MVAGIAPRHTLSPVIRSENTKDLNRAKYMGYATFQFDTQVLALDRHVALGYIFIIFGVAGGVERYSCSIVHRSCRGFREDPVWI